jgi:predicted RNase H-like nuclease (RuvC/YqgF family)
MEESTQNNGIWKVAVGVLAVISGILGYLLFDANSKNKNQEQVINQKVEELASARVRLDSIGSQLDAKIAQIKVLGGNIESLEAAKKQLEADKLQLKKVNAFSKKQYDVKIADFVTLLAAKDAELVQLKRENGELVAKNKDLFSQNSTLTNENMGLKSEKQNLTDSVDNYYRRNRELTAKVTRASALQAQFVQAIALSDKGKERDGGVYRASKVDKIKVIFQLQPNPIAKQDTKTIYMRVFDPDGAVLYDSGVGSGNFDMFGKESTYTVKKDIQFQNNGQGVEIIYGRGSAIQYREGHYKIELFSEGFKIGEGSFDIK